jgi:dTDP-4-amino-4,6-dideoxygalactose transaminase
MTQKLALFGGTPVRRKPFTRWPVFGTEEEQALIRTLRSGNWGRLDGSEVARFERDFADYHQAKHAIAVANGTVSLQIALLAAGIQAGDEVIVPPYTFLSTASAVVSVNATPVFVDVELETFNIDLKLVEAAVTPRTRAVIPVYFGGLPVDMDALLDLAGRNGLTVIEDAAHAHGVEYKGRRVGAIGHMGSFSFQSSKNLTSGEGGIILTNDEVLAERCRSIHNCGRIPGGMWYDHHVISGNYRLSEFQGAVLNAQFARFDSQADVRERNGEYLASRLGRLPGVLPQIRSAYCTRHGYHLFLLRHDSEIVGIPRETFLKALVAEGVPAIAGYARGLDQQPLFANLAFGPYCGYRNARPQLDYRNQRCPNSDKLCSSQAVWLEQRLLLGTQQDMDDIADAFEKVYENRSQLAASNPSASQAST